jgi:hypothetical protein
MHPTATLHLPPADLKDLEKLAEEIKWKAN